MKLTLLPSIWCPFCHSDFEVQAATTEGEEVMEGELKCSCRTYPIHAGVPRILPDTRDERNWKTAYRFGEEWKQFSMLTDEYEKQFLSWIEPVTKESFAGKVVLDVGCGKGRHMVQSKKFGASTVIGIDLSQAVDVAFQNVGREPGMHVIQANVFYLPIKPVCDYGYSIGVLHHTPDPRKAFLSALQGVKPGGTFSAWVYGREGNDWIIYVLNPIRAVTSRLPLPVTKFLSFCLAIPYQLALILLYRPAETKKIAWLKRILPYSAYLCSVSGYSFRENFCIIFDHLVPGIAFYISEGEIRSWFADAGLQDVVITQRYGNSWRGFGRKV